MLPYLLFLTDRFWFKKSSGLWLARVMLLAGILTWRSPSYNGRSTPLLGEQPIMHPHHHEFFLRLDFAIRNLQITWCVHQHFIQLLRILLISAVPLALIEFLPIQVIVSQYFSNLPYLCLF